MQDNFKKAIISGYERVSAWADLLDEINVYPVADGDTGRNLSISLAPLRRIEEGRNNIIQSLLLSARGNSGNIAARFFSGFLTTGIRTFPEAAELGRKYAWEAVSNPKKGTMLTVLDALSEVLGRVKDYESAIGRVLDHLETSVLLTTEMLPRLKNANVVDAGALGMFIFFDGFFNALAGKDREYRPIINIFKDKLSVSSSFNENEEAGYCVDMILTADDESAVKIREMAEEDKSAVVIQDKNFIKIHIHTDDSEKAKDRFGSYAIIKWVADDIDSQIRDFKSRHAKEALHIMTDAAGSVTHKDAKNLGITLLDSYIISGDRCVPETHFEPDELYQSMLEGKKTSTSQASDFERFQNYEFALERYGSVLYLCVGSVYTGNYNKALEWKSKNRADNMTVIDTGTASGRLGISTIATARYSKNTSEPEDVIRFAEKAVELSREYIFLEKLYYLAKGGRISKTSAFFGDMLNIKPIVTPLPSGASKAGIAKSKKEQFFFLYNKLESDLTSDSKAMIMLEYTDNHDWVRDELYKDIQRKFPKAEIIVQPLSLTTGVHTGPGTWGVAYLDL